MANASLSSSGRSKKRVAADQAWSTTASGTPCQTIPKNPTSRHARSMASAAPSAPTSMIGIERVPTVRFKQRSDLDIHSKGPAAVAGPLVAASLLPAETLWGRAVLGHHGYSQLNPRALLILM